MLPLSHKYEIIGRIESFDFVQDLYKLLDVQLEPEPVDPNIPRSPHRYKYDVNKRTADVLVAKILGCDYDDSIYFLLGLGLNEYYMEMDILTVKYTTDEEFRKECKDRYDFIMLALEKQRDLIDQIKFPVRGAITGKNLDML